MGLHIERNFDKKELKINQTEYIKNILKRFGMESANSVKTPMEANLQLLNMGQATEKPYKELIGCLMYVMLGTRPDLCFSISYFSRFQASPTEEHWTYLKRMLRYLQGTAELKLLHC